MEFELVEGRILDRRKRFLADVELPDGTQVVAHLANTGRMTNCWEPGAPCRLSHSNDPKRKLAWSVEQIRMTDWICVNTARPNRIVQEALESPWPPRLCRSAAPAAAVPKGLSGEDRKGLETALERLLKLRGKWDAFQKDEDA